MVAVEPAWGYLNAPIGGVVANPANTVAKDLSGSRVGFLPVLHQEQCIHCGICDMVCPDHCLVWDVVREGDGTWYTQLRGIDYHFCKGCRACIDSCPTGAMTKERETPGFADAQRVPLDWSPRVVDGPRHREPN